MLGLFASPAVVGIYYVAQNVASLPAKLKTSFDPILGPVVAGFGPPFWAAFSFFAMRLRLRAAVFLWIVPLAAVRSSRWTTRRNCCVEQKSMWSR